MRGARIIVGVAAAAVGLLTGNAPASTPTFIDGTLKIDVPVQVITIGLDGAAVAELSDLLEPLEIAHAGIDYNQVLPVDPEEGIDGSAPQSGQREPLPIQPRAIFSVTPASQQLADDLGEAFETWREAPDPNLATPLPTYDATAAETWLATNLVADGFTFDPNTPSLVLIRTDAFGLEAHRWSYHLATGSVGSLDAYMGEREPFAFLDQMLIGEFGANDPADTAEEIRDAARYRVLQGSIYRPSLRPCHAVTLVVGLESSPAVDGVADSRTFDELVDVEAFRGAFQAVTGNPDVYVDPIVLSLPLDDPILDAMARGEYQTLEAQRFWIHENWERYWVPHEGCEAYVSFLVFRENTPGARIVNGIATWDESKGARVSFSWDSEILGAARPTPAYYNFVRYLLTHETGHLFGLRHPHDVTGADGCSEGDGGFSTIWSAMSYDTRQAVAEFSVMDRTNLLRNRAAFMLAAAAERGQVGSNAWFQAMDHLGAYRWQEAGDVLSPAVNALDLPAPKGVNSPEC